VGPGPVWTCTKNLASSGIRSPDRPARSQSHYYTILWDNYNRRSRKQQACQLYIINLEVRPEDGSSFTSRNMLLDDVIKIHSIKLTNRKMC
jgi:hypothetical protein